MVENPKSRLAFGIYVFLSTYVVVLVVFIFCYGKILIVIRRQARIMAGHSAGGASNPQAQVNHQIQSNVIKTMILVCAFYAIAWMPEKIFVLLLTLNITMSFVNDVYYVTLFLAFLYICTNLLLSPLNSSTTSFIRMMVDKCIHTDQRYYSDFSTSAPTHLSTPRNSIRSDAS